jgi:hypothetical protein
MAFSSMIERYALACLWPRVALVSIQKNDFSIFSLLPESLSSLAKGTYLLN